MSASAPTPPHLLRRELAHDGARPFVTFYDDSTGERVELSVTTFDNWVSKTVGLLRDGLGLSDGSVVGLLLPPHWQSMVWAAACWTIGASVQLDDPAASDVVVSDAERLDSAVAAGADDVVALALRPLGGRFTTPLPDGVLDYAVEVPGYPDRLGSITMPDPSEPAVHHAGVTLTHGGVVARASDRAGSLGLGTGARVLVSAENLADTLLDALAVPLVLGGSAVVVRHENALGREGRVASERITAVMPSSNPDDDQS